MTPVGTALHFRTENENLSSSAEVLHKTKNLAISRCCFADDGKEMDKSEKRTCRACKAMGQKARVRLIHETIAFRGSKLACKGHKLK